MKFQRRTRIGKETRVAYTDWSVKDLTMAIKDGENRVRKEQGQVDIMKQALTIARASETAAAVVETRAAATATPIPSVSGA